MGDNRFNPSEMTFTRLSDYFLAKVRAGESPSVEAYAVAFPHLAEEIRENFPALLLLEKTLRREKPRQVSPPATALEGFAIEQEIGRGAMGIVYKARQKDLDRLVALKVIPLQPETATDVVERFELERRAMARLDHPHIVPVYSYGHDDDYAYLAMKLIDGTSLDRLLQEPTDFRATALLTHIRGDWQLFAQIASQIASGLQHTHELGLVHRDIKPANLILDQRQHPWITDFGLAKIHDYSRTVSRTGDAVGTPRYMAPEQLRGVCDARSDVYSLGITLFELAAGRRLWPGSSSRGQEPISTTLSTDHLLSQNPDIPEELAKIIVKACEFSPDDRYQTCKELQFVLERFASGHSKADRRGPYRDDDETYRTKQKRMYRWVAIAGVSAFVLGTASLSLWRSHQQELAAAKEAVARQAATKKNATFVELLANTDEKNVPEIMHDFIRDSVKESGDTLHLNDQEQKEILQHFDQVIDRIEGNMASSTATRPVTATVPQSLAPPQPRSVPGSPTPYQQEQARKQFMQAYEQSTVPTGAAIIGLVRVVERSRLSPQEKSQGYQSIRSFAKLVINRKFPEAEAKAWLARLKSPGQATNPQVGHLRVADAKLRGWLKQLQQRITRYPKADQETLDLDQEIQGFLQNAFPQVAPPHQHP